MSNSHNLDANASQKVPAQPDVPMESDQSDDEDNGLYADEADEEVVDNADVSMVSDESGDDDHLTEEAVNLENDSVAVFGAHKDSIYCIARHPTRPELVVTGGGDEVAYVFDSTPADQSVLSTSSGARPAARERKSLQSLACLRGHSDSINAVTFTLPQGNHIVTAGLDGKLCVFRDVSSDRAGRAWDFSVGAHEVQEIGWLAACPHPQQPNTIAFGASDGSVWVYTINSDGGSGQTELEIVQVYYLHTESSTAGAWTTDGKLLATVSEDGSLYVQDVFGETASSTVGQALMGLTAEDQRFAVEGGCYSIAIPPSNTFVAVGGAGGHIRVVALPLSQTGNDGGAGSSRRQTGQIIASIQVQTDSIETLSFSNLMSSSAPASSLLAAGSVDGSIAIFDPLHQFALRRHIQNAHGGLAVVKLDFVKSSLQGSGLAGNPFLLTSAGMDGVIRQWDIRGGGAQFPSTSAAAGARSTSTQGLLRELRGHRGGGEGGGILDFTQNQDGGMIATAGDE